MLKHQVALHYIALYYINVVFETCIYIYFGNMHLNSDYKVHRITPNAWHVILNL